MIGWYTDSVESLFKKPGSVQKPTISVSDIGLTSEYSLGCVLDWSIRRGFKEWVSLVLFLLTTKKVGESKPYGTVRRYLLLMFIVTVTVRTLQVSVWDPVRIILLFLVTRRKGLRGSSKDGFPQT